MSAAIDIYNDNNGTVYIAGEVRRQIFWICEALGKDRRQIRYNQDLKCYVLVLSSDADKKVFKKLLSQNKRQKKRGKRSS